MHCPPAGTMLARGVAVLAVAVAARLAYVMVASVVEAVALTILGSCVPASWAAWRAVRYGSLRKPRRAEVAKLATSALVRAPYQIPAPPLAIGAPKVIPGEVPGVSATAPLLPVQRTAGMQGTRAASERPV